MLERALFDRHDDARKNGIGRSRDHETKQLGFLAAQAAGAEVWRVAHALGQIANAQLGLCGDVRCIA